MAKFADVVKGIYDTQYEISGKPPKQTDSQEEPKQAISLIDLDDTPAAGAAPPQSRQSSTAAASSKANVLDELSDLFGSSAQISPPPPQQQQQQQQLDPLAFLTSPATAPPATATAVSPTISTSSFGTPSTASDHFQEPVSRNGGGEAHEPGKLSIYHQSLTRVLFAKQKSGFSWPGQQERFTHCSASPTGRYYLVPQSSFL